MGDTSFKYHVMRVPEEQPFLFARYLYPHPIQYTNLLAFTITNDRTEPHKMHTARTKKPPTYATTGGET